MAYDEIIAYNPAFTMAHFHRALALLTLERQSGRRTARLLREAVTEYAFAVNAPDTTAAVRDVAKKLSQRLERIGYQVVLTRRPLDPVAPDQVVAPEICSKGHR